MKSPLSTAALGLALATTASCTTPSVVNTTNNFDRATDVAFLCLEMPTTPGTPVKAVAFGLCGLDPTTNTATGDTATLTHHLHAIVTQSERGELAVVDLAAASGTSLLDNSPDIPGYSFIPVGALPTALLADVRTGNVASSLWVASAADRSIERINADLVRNDPRLANDASPVRSGAVMPMRGTPRDLAMDVVNGRTLLYATMPDQSAVAVFDITDPLHPAELPTANVTAPDRDASADAGDDVDDSSTDASDDRTDASADAGADASADAGADAGADASADAGADAGADASADAGADASADVPDGDMDGSTDGGMDGAVDAGPVDGVPTHPVSIAVDSISHRVFVSDDRSNFVHVLSGTPLAETARIDMGVPTRELAVSGLARRTTCNAEAADPDHYGHAQYLYVTHATTGAVLVYDLTRGARVQPNLLPEPNPQRRLLDPSLPADRVALPAPAVALVPIETADYQTAHPADGGVGVFPANCRTTGGCKGASLWGPTYLHGVFMGVVTRDGRMSFVDIDDYDAPARAGSPNVLDGTNGYAFVRHAARATLPSGFTAVGPKLAAEPALSALLRSTQRAPVVPTPTTPTLGCAHSRSLTGCDAVLGAADNYGVELAPRLTNPSFATSVRPTDPMPLEPASCGPSDAGTEVVRGPADPYAVRNEAWGLTYESILPGLDLYGGAFDVDGERVTLANPGAGFCAHGTLATDLARDLVVLRGDVSLLSDAAHPGSAANMAFARCQELFGTADQSLNRDFVIDEAFQERLVLRPLAGATPTDVKTCFPQAAHFEVRAGGQWVVFGSRNGFLPAVRVGPSGHCEVDPDKQAAVVAAARQCLLTRAPIDARDAAVVPRCPAGRACMARAVSPAGVVTAAATPVFANTFFCLQVFPGVMAAATPGMGPAYVPAPPVRDSQFNFQIQGAWEPLRVEVGTLPVSARFIPSVDRFYVVDTQAAGLIEYRSDPLSRTRIFN